MIKNGDTVINSSGSTVLLEGLDAKFQQAVICISAKLGGFVYDRELGSTVALQSKTLSAKQLELLANESLAEMENAFASIKNVSRKITIDAFIKKYHFFSKCLGAVTRLPSKPLLGMGLAGRFSNLGAL